MKQPCLPEIKVLRHVDLFEDVHEALFVGRFFDLVIERNRDDLRAFTVVEIMAS